MQDKNLIHSVRVGVSTLWALLAISVVVVRAGDGVYDFRMPGVRTNRSDQYLCYAEDFVNNRTYITGFEPLRDKEVTHHMILFSCEEPGSSDTYWTCDGSAGSSPVCKTTPKIIFSWAMEAPSFKLPPDTSLPVGGMPNRYLVLQVHYKDYSSFEKSPEKRDQSGFRMTIKTEPTDYLAGVYLFASDHDVPAKQETILQMGCRYTGAVTIHPFAFRVHAHSHGQMNAGYVIHNRKSYLIGKKSPQKPQTYYLTENQTLLVYPQDYLIAGCKMINKENRVIPIGHSRKDEMCNFYMMYSVPQEFAFQLDDEENQGCGTDLTDLSNRPFLHNLDNPRTSDETDFDQVEPPMIWLDDTYEDDE